MRSSPLPKQFDNSFTHQKVQVTGGCPWWTVNDLLIIRAGHLLVYLQLSANDLPGPEIFQNISRSGRIMPFFQIPGDSDK